MRIFSLACLLFVVVGYVVCHTWRKKALGEKTRMLLSMDLASCLTGQPQACPSDLWERLILTLGPTDTGSTLLLEKSNGNKNEEIEDLSRDLLSDFQRSVNKYNPYSVHVKEIQAHDLLSMKTHNGSPQSTVKSSASETLHHH